MTAASARAMAPIDWQALCQQKKASQQSAIPAEWLLPLPPSSDTLDVRDVPARSGILSHKELEITELDDVDTLLQYLSTGQWSALEVTTSYLKRALIAHQLVNCLTEFWIDDALERAQELDEYFRHHGRPVGPLHGLPVSLKDQFHVKGKELNMGFASWIGRISSDDANLVTVLREAGAVIYARTNVPQTLMKVETSNHVYGVTVSPFNRSLTPGGSSGGEGALLAMKGSPLGVGTDIGGSIRVPASFNGLYGIRPTMRRTPYGGAANTLLGLEAIESSVGPIARTLSGCVTFLRVICNRRIRDLDAKVVDIPWRESQYLLEHLDGPRTKLCLAFFVDDGVVQPLPPVRRAMSIVTERLKRAGHTGWLPFSPITVSNNADLPIFSAGAVDDLAEIWEESGETPIPGIDVTPRAPLTVHQSWKLTQKKDAYRSAFLKKWVSTAAMTGTGRPIDGLLCPVAASPSTPLEKNTYPGYTLVYNLLDVPSVTIPVTSVNPRLDPVDETFEPRSGMDASYHTFYTPEALQNAPVGVQLVGRRWGEEELLGIANIVDKIVNGL